jgi:death on curing protein
VTVFLTLDDVIAVAEAIFAPAQPSIRDVGLLQSAIGRPQATAFGEDAYPTLLRKAAALLESLARNHALVDGNKRVAWTATVLFLNANDTDVVPPTPEQANEFVRAVAQGRLNLDEIAGTLESWTEPMPEVPA